MKVEREELGRNIERAKSSGYDYLIKITAVDYIDNVTVIYFFRNLAEGKDATFEVELQPSDLWLVTIEPLFPAADWYERELQEMFGVIIRGRKAERLLLEKWDGKAYPLRKSFEWGKEYTSG
ncbi:MAG: NADH-quinone oxidoreductase subunit C [Candidatus Marsarchaeota archaeon]|nr:NADH-quinone oxidoreductase subunit C [Candidatus Marsarchaeota archaeon]